MTLDQMLDQHIQNLEEINSRVEAIPQTNKNTVHARWTVYELFVKAWMAYHNAANSVDGHLPPGHLNYKINRMAVQAGREAMNQYVHQDVIQDVIRKNDWKTWTKWQNAKREALRRLNQE